MREKEEADAAAGASAAPGPPAVGGGPPAASACRGSVRAVFLCRTNSVEGRRTCASDQVLLYMSRVCRESERGVAASWPARCLKPPARNSPRGSVLVYETRCG